MVSLYKAVVRFIPIPNRETLAFFKYEKNPKVFTDYWQAIDDVDENLEEYNPTKKKNFSNSLWLYDSRCECL